MTTKAPGWATDLDLLLRARFRPRVPFTIEDAYSLIPELTRGRPDARNIEARIRDALQQLRHKKRLDFLARGRYALRA